MSEGAFESIDPADAESAAEGRGSNRDFPLMRIAVFVSIWLGASWLIVGSWLHSVLPGGWIAVAAGLVIGALAFRVVTRGFRGLSYPGAVTRLLVLRPFWYAMLFLPLLAGATLIGALAGLPFGASGPAGRWALGGCAAILALALLVGYIGTRRLSVRRLEVHLPRLPPPFDGMRVVQLSDLHVGPHTPRGFLKRIAETVQGETPELIAITGDQVDDYARDVEHFVAAFGGLQAPFGIFAIPGNHDVYAGWAGVHEGLSAAGFTVLVNDAVSVEREGHRLWVAGTGDPAAKHWPGSDLTHVAPHIGRTLAAVPADEAVLALAHNPGLWPALVERDVDLTLSGHTHYGQLVIPGRNWSMASAFLELAMGWHQRDRSLLYINPGTNYWGIPFRLGTPPEVTVLTLRTGGDGRHGIREM